jgi:hypothetical protein
VLLLAALRLPNVSSPSPPSSSKKKKPGCVVFWGADRGAFSPESSSSLTGGESETLPRDARVSDSFVSALALALSLGPSSRRIALAAVDSHRPPVVPFGSSSASASATTSADEEDMEALEAVSALGEVAAEALGALRFSRAKAARLVPSRSALLEAAASAASSAGMKSNSAAAADDDDDGAYAPPLPLLQVAEQMYG